MKIKFMKTHPNAVIPTRGSAGEAGQKEEDHAR